jgi:hypothetical protein
MYYDFDQLSKDLTRIATVLGQRKQHGFFTARVYKDENLSIFDLFDTPVVKYQEKDLDLDFLEMDHPAAQKILELAVKTDV